MDNKDLVTVFTVATSTEGEIVKNFLQAEGIRAFLEGANQAGEAGLIGISIKVQVALENADKARKIIESHSARHGAKPHGWTEQKK